MKIQEILEFLDGMELAYTFQGDPLAQVERFSSLSHYCPGSFTWVKALKNVPEHFDLSALTLVFTGPDMELEGAANVIRTAESKRAFFSTIEHFYGEDETRPAIGQGTYIGPRVKLGNNVRIGHNCTLDGEITIGDDTVIWNNVVMVNRVTVGSRCTICSGTVIGHDGFGFTEDAAHRKTMVRHFGGVHIGVTLPFWKIAASAGASLTTPSSAPALRSMPRSAWGITASWAKTPHLCAVPASTDPAASEHTAMWPPVLSAIRYRWRKAAL